MYLHFFRFITDEPEIDVEAEKVHSGVGKEAHLTCIVHGEPRPSVSFDTIVGSVRVPDFKTTKYLIRK